MVRRSFLWMTAVFLMLSTTFSAAQETGFERLWSIGKEDNSTNEFFLAPDRFRDYTRDSSFLVGTSESDRDWSYVHPGPADNWAGSREHTFTIFFQLNSVPSGAGGQLTIDCTAVQSRTPPGLSVKLNGHTLKRAELPAGTEDAPVFGDLSPAKEHRLTIDVPAGQLTKGVNQIRINNVSGSWFLYDAVIFRGPPDLRTVSLPNPLITSVDASERIIKANGQSVQTVTWTVLNQGDPETYNLRIRDTNVSKQISTGRHTFTTSVPSPAESIRARARLVRNNRTIHSVPVTIPAGREMEPVDWVDPMIGTSTSRWMLYPGPSMPFGMVKLSPDNQEEQWKAGYEYTIENIAGFSHLHSWTMGGLLTMPTTGDRQIQPGPETAPDQGYRSRFSHRRESASPGYYSVFLDDYGIRAELTCTTRAGFQRYTYPESDQSRILFDLEFPTEYGFQVLDARVRRISDTEIAGAVTQKSTGYNKYTLHFVARLDRPFEQFGGWTGGEIKTGVDEIAGKGDTGVFLEFSTEQDETVRLQTGISFVSIDQARKNLETEMQPFGWSFDRVRQNARDTWNQLLSKIEVEGGTGTNFKKFYTNLYRSYTARTILNDVDGTYVDMHEEVQKLDNPDSPVYGADAFWNTFWNLNQLWTLVNPDIAESWVRSFLEMYDRGGWLPKGPTGFEYSSIMVASHEIPLMVSAYQKGLRNYDTEKMYEAIIHNQTEPGRPHPGGGHVGNKQLASYLKHGYVPMEAGPVSNTLEYAFDDWCVAQLARAMGKDEDEKEFLKRAAFYRNVFDRSVGYVRPRHADGTWKRKFDPFTGAGYVEGNAWQYTFFVPHDVRGLIQLMGKKQFNDRLNLGFIRARPTNFNASGDQFKRFTVNHGNQPNMQAAYLFNYSGKPWLTQKWARAIMDHYYGVKPTNGWPGDEDQGQMGAWFVMSSMGLFEMRGGAAVDPVYEIGSPLFKRITIHLGDAYPGDTFEIVARNNSEENVYVRSAKLDGEPLKKPWFFHRDLVDGGKLVLNMGSEPNRDWGSDPEDAPPSMTE